MLQNIYYIIHLLLQSKYKIIVYLFIYSIIYLSITNTQIASCMMENNEILETSETKNISSQGAMDLKREITDFANNQIQLLEQIDNQDRQITELKKELENKKYEETYFNYDAYWYDEETEKQLKDQIHSTEYKLKSVEKQLSNYKDSYNRLNKKFDTLRIERELLDSREEYLRGLRETINQEFQILEDRKDNIQIKERSILATEDWLQLQLESNRKEHDNLCEEYARQRTKFYKDTIKYKTLATTNSLRFEREYNQRLVEAIEEIRKRSDYQLPIKYSIITRRNSF